MVRDVTTPTIAEIGAALSATGPGTPRLQEVTPLSNTGAFYKTTIAPLALVHQLLRSPFLTPTNAWNLIPARAVSLGLESRVSPLFHWIRYHIYAHTISVDTLYSVDLVGAMLQSSQELRERVIPSPPPSQMHTPVQFTPRLPKAAAPTPMAKQAISANDRWGDTLNRLLRLCNVIVSSNLPPI